MKIVVHSLFCGSTNVFSAYYLFKLNRIFHMVITCKETCGICYKYLDPFTSHEEAGEGPVKLGWRHGRGTVDGGRLR